ncbi:MAG: GDP-mannose 4,6-dehydratase [Candidatus Sericytochromatia bacterium]
MSRNVLVTGAGGFIGSHLCEALVRAGYGVQALVHSNAGKDFGSISQLAPEIRREIKVVLGEIRDSEQMRGLIKGKQLVFHLAALVRAPFSYQATRAFIETNVTGTLNILHASLAHDCRIIQASTSEVYGTALYLPIDELHPLQGHSPFSASRIASDMLAESFFRSFKLPVTVLRPFPTYGPRQTAGVIPALLEQLYGDSETFDPGDGMATLDLCYVADTVAAFLAAAGAPASIGEVIQLGTGREVSRTELAGLLMQLTGIRKPLTSGEGAELGPGERSCCDAAKAQSLLDWQPHFSLEQGLQQTLAWQGIPPRLAGQRSDW